MAAFVGADAPDAPLSLKFFYLLFDSPVLDTYVLNEFCNRDCRVNPHEFDDFLCTFLCTFCSCHILL